MERKLFSLAVLLACGLLLAGCGLRPVVPTPTPAATPTPADRARTNEYLDIFDTVWQTINDSYFDPEFGGVDWRAEHDRYQPLIAQVDNDQTFYQLVNQMLWSLNVSHTGVGPVAEWSSAEPVVAAEGTTGLGVRLLDGEAVVTRVEPTSAGEKAGLRPGFVLESIDGVTIEQIIADAETQLGPPFNERGRIEGLTRGILSRLYGTPDTCVAVAYLDESSQQHEPCITRIRRERAAVMQGTALPPSLLEFEVKRLEQDIGYIRFNTFHPDLIPDMQNAIQSMQDARGIIIDLRGNPGGDPIATHALAAQFLKGAVSFCTYLTRDGPIDQILEPAEETYEGPVLILIDTMSTSASEEFAGGMQAIRRAVIIGEQSPGSVCGANVKLLPNGALLVFPTMELIAPDGTVLEGQGVIPDIQVEVDRKLLLQGIDSQLEAAIDYIEER